ncbi:MAG: glycosyltransferase family 39 protein [Lentisphaeria bacterium]|nr:glycosyltransferase family 39 protein [Lentisphaeria bacterium]
MKIMLFLLDPSLGRDASLYLDIAQNWHRVRDYTLALRETTMTWLPPFFFLLLKCGLDLGLNAESSGIIINILSGVLCVLCGYGITLEAVNCKKTALICAGFLAVSPGLNMLAVEIQRDTPYLCLAGFAIWGALAGIRRKKVLPFCISGVFTAMAILTRNEALELPLFLFVILLCCALFRKHTWKQFLLYVCGFSVSCLIVLAAFFCIIGLHRQIGSWKIYFTHKYERVEKQFTVQKEPGE